MILGGPGAGKTTAMLLLIDILEHPGEGSGEPAPVWLTLGGWNPGTTPLQAWAADRLDRDYPGLAAYGGPGTAAELIRTGRVTLFLDGLDEMAPALRGRALEAIERETVGIGGGLVSGLLVELGPSGHLTAMQPLWRLRGQRVRFLPLPQVAFDRQVLRRTGAVYQFRHAAMQDLLAGPSTTVGPDPDSPSHGAAPSG